MQWVVVYGTSGKVLFRFSPCAEDNIITKLWHSAHCTEAGTWGSMKALITLHSASTVLMNVFPKWGLMLSKGSEAYHLRTNRQGDKIGER